VRGNCGRKKRRAQKRKIVLEATRGANTEVTTSDKHGRSLMEDRAMPVFSSERSALSSTWPGDTLKTDDQ